MKHAKSNVEDVSEQTRGRETEPTTQGRCKKDKSHDALANMEARLANVELAMVNTREMVDLIEQYMEKSLKDLREYIQDLHEDVLVSQVQPVSQEEFISFQDKVMSMFANMKSMMKALASLMEAWDHEVQQELTIYKAAMMEWVIATLKVSRVKVSKPQGFSGNKDVKELDKFL